MHAMTSGIQLKNLLNSMQQASNPPFSVPTRPRTPLTPRNEIISVGGSRASPLYATCLQHTWRRSRPAPARTQPPGDVGCFLESPGTRLWHILTPGVADSSKLTIKIPTKHIFVASQIPKTASPVPQNLCFSRPAAIFRPDHHNIPTYLRSDSTRARTGRPPLPVYRAVDGRRSGSQSWPADRQLAEVVGFVSNTASVA